MGSPRRKRVLMVAPLPPPVHGQSLMSDYLRRSVLLNSRYDCRYVNIATARTIAELGRTRPMKLVRYAWSYCRLLWLLLAFRPDSCYLSITCHGPAFLKNAPYVLLCKLFCRRIIIHHHNKGMASCVERPVYRRLMPMVYRRATVVLLSWRLYPDVERVVGREQVRIVANGIPDVAAPRHATANGGQADGSAAGGGYAPRLLFLSNMIESKGVLTLLDACRLLSERGMRFTCRFVGAETAEIDRRRFAREVAARGLAGVASYAGPRYGADKERELDEADVLVFPSRYPNECFPLTLLEAMAHALPIVASDEGAIADIVDDGSTGFICRHELTAATLAERLAQLLASPAQRRQMGRNARLRYERLFTLERFERAVASLL